MNDLDQDADFLAFMQENNNDRATYEWIKKELEPAHNGMMRDIEAASAICIRKAQSDAKNGVFYDENTENQETSSSSSASAPSTAAKPSVKQSKQHQSTIKKNTTSKRPSLDMLEDDDTDNQQQQSISKQPKTDLQPLGKGEVRLTVLCTSESGVRHKGTVVTVKPYPPSDKGKRHVKVGRRDNDTEICNYGLCLSDDVEVSGLHGTLYRKKNKFYWQDNKSTNGTVAIYPDDERIHLKPKQLFELEDGIKLELGLCVLLVNFAATH
jgi:hypothetical protein